MNIRTIVSKEDWDLFFEKLKDRTNAEWLDVGSLENRNPFDDPVYTGAKYKASIVTNTDKQDCGLKFFNYVDFHSHELTNEEFVTACEIIFPKHKDDYSEKHNSLLAEKWMEDMLENLRNGYAIVLLPTFGLVSTFGFSMGQSEDIENELQKLINNSNFMVVKAEWKESIGEGCGYIVVKPVYRGLYWEFEFDNYCNKKNYITKLINKMDV
jgi:hypothetical protein